MTRSVRFLALTAFGVACGGEKPQSADSTPKAAPQVQPAPNPSDTLKPATGAPAKPKGDSTGTKKAEGPLRDSAFGPKFTVDSTGKATPIKKKP